MIVVSEAERIIFSAVSLAPMVECPLEAAAGEVLREPVVADRPFPPYDRVAMDGIALASSAWRQGTTTFPIEGTQRAGEPPHELRAPGGCWEVMTGAVLPKGCDCVVPVEQITVMDGAATLRAGLELAPQQNVHGQGSDRPAGATLLSSGTLLLGPQIAVAASVGKSRVRVAARPGIGVVSTGDELVPVESVPQAHQVRRSNSHALGAALHTAGFHDASLQHVPDDPDAIERVLAARLDDCRFLILSGGVSAGRYDHVPTVLAHLGVEARFHKVSQRPGQPLWFGVGRSGQLVFGLPGNPVSALVCFQRYVLPALWAHLGATLCAPAARPHARLCEPVTVRKPLTLFQPVRVTTAADGVREATPVPLNGSGDLAGLAESDGVLELPGGARTFAAGEAHPLWLWADAYGIIAPPG